MEKEHTICDSSMAYAMAFAPWVVGVAMIWMEPPMWPAALLFGVATSFLALLVNIRAIGRKVTLTDRNVTVYSWNREVISFQYEDISTYRPFNGYSGYLLCLCDGTVVNLSTPSPSSHNIMKNFLVTYGNRQEKDCQQEPESAG